MGADQNPLPLTDFLAVLRSRGLTIGLREYMTLSRLLEHCQDIDAITLRAALSATFARNQEEAETVREVFDELYPPTPLPQTATVDGAITTGHGAGWLAILRWLVRRWIVAVATTFLIIGGIVWWRFRHHEVPIHLAPQQQTLNSLVDPNKVPAPPKPSAPDLPPEWHRSIPMAVLPALTFFLWLYVVRQRELRRQVLRRSWAEDIESLPPPPEYQLRLHDLAPPFSSETLDDLAKEVSGREGVERGRRLDIERTIGKTLERGLAPELVMCVARFTQPVVVLEDISLEMRPWRRHVSALIEGLVTRGVFIDRWQFDADASQLYRPGESAAIALRTLARFRSGSPLIVISTGAGIEMAQTLPSWTLRLTDFSSRIWLHPVKDPRYWRRSLRYLPIDVHAMSPAGLLEGAKSLRHSRVFDRQRRWPLPNRRVQPLEVDRLRWMLSLYPKHTPELAELLRQRFCPGAPDSIILETLATALPPKPPSVEPAPQEVHAYLLQVIDESRPDPQTAAEARWRLDRAVQQMHFVEQRSLALETIGDLAAGPLGPEVEDTLEFAIRDLDETAVRTIRRIVRKGIRKRALRREVGASKDKTLPISRRPSIGELVATIVVALIGVGYAFRRTPPPKPEFGYKVEQLGDPLHGPFSLTVSRLLPQVAQKTQGDSGIRAAGGPLTPAEPDLYQDGRSFRQKLLHLTGSEVSSLSFDESDRDHWYDVRASEGARFVVSSPLWVAGPKSAAEIRQETPTPPVVRSPTSTTLASKISTPKTVEASPTPLIAASPNPITTPSFTPPCDLTGLWLLMEPATGGQACLCGCGAITLFVKGESISGYWPTGCKINGVIRDGTFRLEFQNTGPDDLVIMEGKETDCNQAVGEWSRQRTGERKSLEFRRQKPPEASRARAD